MRNPGRLDPDQSPSSRERCHCLPRCDLSVLAEVLDYAVRGVTIPVGADGSRHLGINLLILEQPLRFYYDPLAVGADDSNRACFYGLRPLCHLSQNENRLSEHRRLLLNSTRVRKYHVALSHQGHKAPIGDRRHQLNIRFVLEDLVHHVANRRVRVDRINDLKVRVAVNQVAEGQTNLLEWASQILTTMRSHEDIRLSNALWKIFHLLGDAQQRIDDGVASPHDNVLRNALAEKPVHCA